MQRKARHRWGSAAVSATAFAVALGSQGVAVALPDAPEMADRRFASSYESDDPVPEQSEGALFDDTSATDAAATSVELPVSERARAVQYTLTSSSDRAKAPSGWTLQGSSDGTTWRTLDRRSGESFAWDRRTRAFSVRASGTYERYRLVLDGEGTLAKVELLA